MGSRSCSSNTSSGVCRIGAVRRWVGAVVVGLLVSIGQWLPEALDDAHDPVRGVRASESIREDITGGQVNGLLVQVVGEHDETGVELRSLLQDTFECGNDTRSADGTGRNVPVVGVKVVAVVASPDDGGEAHCNTNGPNTVVNISIRWSEGVWCYTIGPKAVSTSVLNLE